MSDWRPDFIEQDSKFHSKNYKEENLDKFKMNIIFLFYFIKCNMSKHTSVLLNKNILVLLFDLLYMT